MLGKILEVKIKCTSLINLGHNFIFLGEYKDYKCYVFSKEENNIFTGKVIGMVDDELIVSNDLISKEVIYSALTKIKNVQDIRIVMNESSYDDLLWDIKRSGIMPSDKLMIHSSLRSVGKICGGPTVLVEAFKKALEDGLLVFPTHTWASIQKDEQVFNVDESNSCVGALTNVARCMDGFKRSAHPTHSVCAWGNGKEEYLKLDLSAKTPASPNGCFGGLKDINAKILFLGAPLSKNTFVHSVEEEMDVKDRFTDHIYHFISVDGDIKRDFYMPRHYSTKSAHISDHYEKLLPTMLRLDIAKKVYIGNSISYLVDAKGCHDLVVDILNKDIHAFDDFREIDHLV